LANATTATRPPRQRPRPRTASARDGSAADGTGPGHRPGHHQARGRASARPARRRRLPPDHTERELPRARRVLLGGRAWRSAGWPVTARRLPASRSAVTGAGS